MAYENLKSTGIKYLLGKLKGYFLDTFLQIKDAVNSVNGNFPDANGDITLTSVPYAQNLESSATQRDYALMNFRTSGGESSIEDGDAWLMDIKGNNVHDGYVAESITTSVAPEREDQISIEIDRDTFVSYVDASGTTTLVYSTAWSEDPANYGVTITGTPVAGDTITIVYVKEVRGTITVADPSGFVSTGWNLYNHTDGYAKVKKYAHGYMISGTYTALQYSATEAGTKSAVTVTNGNFDIPADGFVWVTGGNSTDTAIWATWEDWTEEYETEFSAYSQTAIDLSTVMDSKFPYGLMKAGSVLDEINLNLGTAIQRVERLEYTDANLASAKASGREYEYDENYIYLALATPVSSSVEVDGSMMSSDHGIEYFIGTAVPIHTEILYGNNLKNKLERNVLTISAQNLTEQQKTQVQQNLGLDEINNKINIQTVSITLSATVNTEVYVQLPAGFTISNCFIIGARLTYSSTISFGMDARFTVEIKSDGTIGAYATTAEFTSKVIEVMLIKISN